MFVDQSASPAAAQRVDEVVASIEADVLCVGCVDKARLGESQRGHAVYKRAVTNLELRAVAVNSWH